MAKVDFRDISGKERLKMVGELADMLLAIKNKRDMVQVLHRLLTPSELVMLGRRKQIAEMLITGRTYTHIREKLGVGVATIRSVERWLEDAVRNFDMHRREQRAIAIQRELQLRSRERVEPDIVGSFTDIRHRYGGAFLLLNLLLDYPLKQVKKIKNRGGAR